MKTKIVMREQYKPDMVTQGKPSVMENIKKAKQVFVHELGKYNNGDEYLIYKVLL